MAFKLIPEAKKAWRMFSVQAMAAAGAIQGAWVFMPDDMRDSLPKGLVAGITVGLLALGTAGRLITQPKVKS